MKTIGIYTNVTHDSGLCGTRKVLDLLSGKAGIVLHNSLENTAGELCRGRTDISFLSDSEFFSKPDIIIVLGGDGTILKAARACAPLGIPILGVNLGRVGYMAELEADELCLLYRLISDDYTVEERMMIEAEVGPRRLFALNEAVLGGSSIFRIVEIELYCDGKPVNHYRADGLIAATPTGSTAYSMSASGPVVDPCMDAMIVTPICSHSLNATPIVFSPSSELTMKNLSEREERLYLNVDGCETVEIGYGEVVKIRRRDERARFVRLKDGGFYEVLRRKMADNH